MDVAGAVAGSRPETERHRRALRIWLLCVAAMIFAMVMVGGATRLTQSGLSIVEWQPVIGALPPIGEGQWQVEFDKYKTIPQYQLLNRGMSVDEFKVIYWWEWSHRQLGRLIGVAFALPLLVLWLAGWVEPRLKPRLLALLALGGSQGALGWWMVASGLSGRTDVSQIRLALHLTLASIIFAAIVWVAQGLAPARRAEPVAAPWRGLSYALVLVVFLQIFLGGLVAGLDAGLAYNSWPLMDGHLIPPTSDLYIMRPAWANHLDNALTVQFQHRLTAYLLCALAVWQAIALGRAQAGRHARRANVIAALVLVQAAIGIATLLLVVPLWAALIHQAVAILVLAAATVHARAVADSAVPARVQLAVPSA
jgi:heme a synthase